MANWAVRFQTLFLAFVRFKGLVHTCITCHTMEVINPKSFSNSAHVAVRPATTLPIVGQSNEEMGKNMIKTKDHLIRSTPKSVIKLISLNPDREKSSPLKDH